VGRQSAETSALTAGPLSHARAPAAASTVCEAISVLIAARRRFSCRRHEIDHPVGNEMKRTLVVTTVVAALGLVACGEPNLAGAPDVRGINLHDANTQLEEAGFSSTIIDNDGVFGVVIEENFVVCDQEDTSGKLVPLKVAKHGC
jgi:hypothetical protein